MQYNVVIDLAKLHFSLAFGVFQISDRRRCALGI